MQVGFFFVTLHLIYVLIDLPRCMLQTKRRLNIWLLLAFLFCCTAVHAVNEEELVRLEADMLQYLSSNDRTNFSKAAEKLKRVSLEAGSDRLFYKAWANQAIFEATTQDYPKALGIAQEIMAYARKHGSALGEYYALHAKASVLLQKQEYEEAERAFQEAVGFHHRHFPNESAAEDLQELMKIANQRKDVKTAMRYARQIIAEPNVTPSHKGRALYRLSLMAFEQDNVEEFNRIYGEMMKLQDNEYIGSVRPLLEVNYCIMNGRYEEALRLTEQLSEEERAERMAVIYHRRGDDTKAYEYLMEYKRINDSITLVSHGNVVSSYYVQMNNVRLQLQQLMLENQNQKLRTRIWILVGIAGALLLLFLLLRGRKNTRLLGDELKRLKYEKKDAERSLKELHELSFYESKTELPLTEPVDVIDRCNRLTTSAQVRCKKGVTMLFQTDLPENFLLVTNSEALRKLLNHLLNYSARFTRKGIIKLSCTDAGDYVRFCVSDTSAGLGNPQKQSIIGMFSEHNNEVRYVGMNFNICQSITRLLHGRIWLDGEYTNGTRFCVELPKKVE